MSAAVRVVPHAEKTAEQLRIEISHLDRAIAALERYAWLTMGTVPAKKTAVKKRGERKAGSPKAAAKRKKADTGNADA